MANYITEKSKRKITTDAFIGGGSTADVFNIKQNSTECAKILKNPTEAEHKKLLDMMEIVMKIGLKPYDVDGRLVFAWPTDILLDLSGNFAGFLMPRVLNTKINLYSAIIENRDKTFPHWDIGYNVKIARNLAHHLAMLHAGKISLGDLNEANFIICQDLSLILIDLDSVNYTARDGTTYHCHVARPELRAPEIQGIDLKIRPLTNERTDCFGLAVHIFLLLCLEHPFRCQFQPGSSPSAGYEQTISNGDCPYLPGSTATVPDESKGMEQMKRLPQEIQDLFIRCFRYNSMTACKKETIQDRPSAFEWFQALDKWLHSAHGSFPQPQSNQKKIGCLSMLVIAFVAIAAMIGGLYLQSHAHDNLPENGHIFYSEFNQEDALCNFTVVNGDTDSMYVKLVDADNNKDMIAFFVRGNDSASVDIPNGEYILRYACGTLRQWDNARDLFGEDTIYYDNKDDTLVVEGEYTIYHNFDENVPEGTGVINLSRIDSDDF